MGQTADQARQERELSRQALADRVQHFEARVREELDWRARLRRNRLKLAVAGATVAVLVAGVVVLRARRSAGGSAEPATLDDVTAELNAIRRQLEHGGESPLWQRLIVRSAVAAATAGGATLARRMVQSGEARQEAGAG